MNESMKENAIVNPVKMITEHLEALNPGQIRSFERNVYDEVIGHQYRSREESLEEGKQLRKQFPRSSQGEWTVQKNRTDAVDLIFAEEKGRIQERIPIRHERMAGSAFAFYRASAAVMAHDLSANPVTGITVQACGDAHISNFGVFSSPERNLVFDINDFDETLPVDGGYSTI